MKSARLLFAVGSSLAVTATIVAGLFIAGSPSEQRMKRADEQRAQHLQQITYAVDSFWNTNNRLPSSLKELATSPNVFVQQTTDPKTQMPYEFRVVTEKSYEICATFETSTDGQVNGKTTVPRPVSGPDGQYWTHGAERTCFTIEPRTYPKPM